MLPVKTEKTRIKKQFNTKEETKCDNRKNTPTANAMMAVEIEMNLIILTHVKKRKVIFYEKIVYFTKKQHFLLNISAGFLYQVVFT